MAAQVYGEASSMRSSRSYSIPLPSPPESTKSDGLSCSSSIKSTRSSFETASFSKPATALPNIPLMTPPASNRPSVDQAAQRELTLSQVFARVSSTLANDVLYIAHLSIDTALELARCLNRRFGRMKYQYDISKRLFVVFKPGIAHEQTAEGMRIVLEAAAKALSASDETVGFFAAGTPSLLMTRNGKQYGDRMSDLSARLGFGDELDIGVGSAYGSITLEVGVSQWLYSLRRAAWAWLNLTEGRVRIVFLVKLHKPKEKEKLSEYHNWRAELEVLTRKELFYELEAKTAGNSEVVEVHEDEIDVRDNAEDQIDEDCDLYDAAEDDPFDEGFLSRPRQGPLPSNVDLDDLAEIGHYTLLPEPDDNKPIPTVKLPSHLLFAKVDVDKRKGFFEANPFVQVSLQPLIKKIKWGIATQVAHVAERAQYSKRKQLDTDDEGPSAKRRIRITKLTI